LTMAEVNEAVVLEGGEAQEGVLASVEIHNSILTFLTPSCNSCNLGDNLWVSPLNLNFLNLIIYKLGLIAHFNQHATYHTDLQYK
jgi:hypothetical protein